MKHSKFIFTTLLSTTMACLYGGAMAATQQAQDAKANGRSLSSSAVYLASPSYSFDMFFSAMYLQPTGSHLYYAAQADPLPALSPHWIIRDIKTDYDFGYDVGINGIFHGANSSLNLDWQRFHNGDSARKSLPESEMIGGFFEIGPNSTPYKKGRGHVSFHFDQVNLDYGQFVNFGNRLQTNMNVGVGFARIKQTLQSTFSDTAGTTTRLVKTPSTFSGAGPQIGLNFTYRIVDGFQFVGQTGASLFVGHLKNHTSFASTSPLNVALGAENPNKQTISVHKRIQVVPGFEGQLGFAYHYCFKRHFMFKIEAGYDAQIYLNAVQTTDLGSQVDDLSVSDETVGVFARTFQRTLSNFALAGPYAKVEFGF